MLSKEKKRVKPLNVVNALPTLTFRLSTFLNMSRHGPKYAALALTT